LIEFRDAVTRDAGVALHHRLRRAGASALELAVAAPPVETNHSTDDAQSQADGVLDVEQGNGGQHQG
jgi:hypothetical protein